MELRRCDVCKNVFEPPQGYVLRFSYRTGCKIIREWPEDDFDLCVKCFKIFQKFLANKIGEADENVP